MPSFLPSEELFDFEDRCVDLSLPPLAVVVVGVGECDEDFASLLRDLTAALPLLATFEPADSDDDETSASFDFGFEASLLVVVVVVAVAVGSLVGCFVAGFLLSIFEPVA